MRFYTGDPARSSRAYALARYGGAAQGRRSGQAQRPDFDIVLINDPLYEVEQVLQRLEAADPAMDRINRIAEGAVGLGTTPDGRPTWYGRTCCYVVAEVLHEDGPRGKLPMTKTCPVCNREWQIRVTGGLYRGPDAAIV